jgi:hypothetical protein
MPDDRFLHKRAGTSAKVSLLNDLEYRVWTQYLLSANDFGVMAFDHVALQNGNAHLKRRPIKTLMRCLEAVKGRGLIHTFDHQGQTYCYQPDWQDWQKVRWPGKTLLPRPPLEGMTPATLHQFSVFPGGKGVPKLTNEELAQNYGSTSEVLPKNFVGTSATRVMANGLRPMARNSSEEELPKFDEWFRQLQEDYPQQRVTAGYLTQTAFIDALVGYREGPRLAWGQMQANLENQKRGHQWRVKRMIPKLDNWLRSGAWLQQHDETPPEALVTDKTARNLTAAAAFIKAGGE